MHSSETNGVAYQIQLYHFVCTVKASTNDHLYKSYKRPLRTGLTVFLIFLPITFLKVIWKTTISFVKQLRITDRTFKVLMSWHKQIINMHREKEMRMKNNIKLQKNAFCNDAVKMQY